MKPKVTVELDEHSLEVVGKLGRNKLKNLPPAQDLVIDEERWEWIKVMRKQAKENNRCSEQHDHQCMFPHCNCLFGKFGPIDPITGEGYTDD